MPRHPHLFLPGATYHVYCRAGHALDDLASRYRAGSLIQGRIEFATLAISRFGFRVCDVAALISKHGNSVTLWLNQGLRKESSDADFTKRLAQLDAAISL